MTDHLALLRVAATTAYDVAARLEQGTRGRDVANAYASGIRQAGTIAQDAHDADDPEAAELRDGWHRLANHPAIRPPHWEPGNGQSYLDAVLEHLDGLTVRDATTPADLHHDPRPWQDCTRKDIRKGDLVEARRRDGLRIGVAHHQYKDGDWYTEDGFLLTYDDRWPLRRIPAPTR